MARKLVNGCSIIQWTKTLLVNFSFRFLSSIFVHFKSGAIHIQFSKKSPINEVPSECRRLCGELCGCCKLGQVHVAMSAMQTLHYKIKSDLELIRSKIIGESSKIPNQLSVKTNSNSGFYFLRVFQLYHSDHVIFTSSMPQGETI